MQNGCMRLRGTIFCVPLLLAACGGTTVETGDDALVAAEAEIVALEAEIAELEEQLDEKTSEATKTTRNSHEVDLGSQVSSGPCGVFRFDGNRILRLDYELDERGTVVKQVDGRGQFEWVESGIDFPGPTPGFEPKDSDTWLGRAPDTVLAFKVADDVNHFWGMLWTPDAWLVLPDAHPPKWEVDGLLPGDRFGFFGPDEDCDWGWIPVEEALLEIDSTGVEKELLTFVYGSDGVTVEWIKEMHYLNHWWFVEFRHKDYSCPYNDYSSSVYDPERHVFVSQCPEG